MASPTAYELSYDFTAFQVANPASPLPADKLEIELNNLQKTTDELIVNLNILQRSDGQLNNGIVGYDSLSDVVKALFSAVPEGETGGGEVIVGGGDTKAPRLVTTASATFADGDTFIGFNSWVASEKALTLGEPTTTQNLVVKDVVGSAGTHNIVITGDGCTIDGQSSFTIDRDYGAVSLKWDGTSNWMVF